MSERCPGHRSLIPRVRSPQGVAGHIAEGVDVYRVVLGLLKYTEEGVDALGQVLDLGPV